ncbi:T9SS type A sorting domain-containing protein [Belliella sp. R4-6]|uniref:T9SS type A sorting domain-containing protein n=1 Tax=Belliella alkalica TaxID=1730871 RepID=A0ABS9V8U9_9BACT|nr:T9SS type A sorting domain-containing protein [Belliella alkalica]MCH7412851.1 T9SS type A sorting domain-containing protein [Belliella alkalica]
MKSFLLICACLILLLPISLDAQVRVLSENIEFVGKIGDSQRKSLIIQNDSDQSKEYNLKFLRGNIGTSQKVKLCIGDVCFDPKKDISKVRLKLKPNEIFTDLYLEFDYGIVETRGNFEFHFVNPENNRDLFVIDAIYNVTNPNREGSDVDHKDISIGSVYPNPSNRIAQLDYSFKNSRATAKISVNSFIGNPVAEYRLDPRQKTLVMNVEGLRPGVYLYTLVVDNKNIITKKFVVE